MTYTTQVPAATAVLAARPVPTTGLGLRLYLLHRAATLMLTALVGAVLFSLWLTIVAVSPLTVVAGLVLPVTAAVRAYANAHRRAAGALLGESIAPPYRAVSGTWPHRVWTIVRDPASWRDALWLLAHAVVGCVVSFVQVALFVGTLFYLIYPFLYWVTPPNVFNRPFGYFTLHSVAQSAGLMPLAIISFALWYGTAVPLSRIEASLTRSLLR